MGNFTVVFCTLADCLHYHPEPAAESKCRCSHPEKPNYTTQVKCPLYRLDWQKQLKSKAEAVKRAEPKKRDKLPQDF